MAQSQYDYSYRLRQELQKKIAGFVTFIVVVLILLAFFLRFVLFSVSVHTGAMEPDTKQGSLLFVSPLFSSEPALRFFTLSRGDMVLAFPRVEKKPALFKRVIDNIVGFFTFQKITLFSSAHAIAENVFVSRVLGFPGDTVYMNDFILYIKPSDSLLFLTEFELSSPKNYNVGVAELPKNWDNTMGVMGSFSEITLGGDEYFLLCDNRTSSADSRVWGVIRGAQIQGRALVRYIPLDTVSLL